MLGRTHALLAACVYMSAAPLVGVDGVDLVVGTLVCAGAGVAPDLDHPSSSMTNALGVIGRPVSSLVSAVSGGHRAGTHSLVGSLIATAGAWWLAMVSPSMWPLAIVAAFLASVALPLLAVQLRRGTAASAGLLVGIATGWAVIAAVGGGVWFPFAVAVGWTLHWLPGDMITPQGVPVAWPLSKRRVSLALLVTGSRKEAVLAAGLAVWAVFLTVRVVLGH